jgi:hypothetical protein
MRLTAEFDLSTVKDQMLTHAAILWRQKLGTHLVYVLAVDDLIGFLRFRCPSSPWTWAWIPIYIFGTGRTDSISYLDLIEPIQ